MSPKRSREYGRRHDAACVCPQCENTPRAGYGFSVGERVQLHAATDEWMQGDRYGTVIGYGRPTAFIDTETKERGTVRPVRVRLDKSGRTRRFHPDNLYPTGEFDSDVGGNPGPLDRLRHHVTGAIERGEKQAITERRAVSPTTRRRSSASSPGSTAGPRRAGPGPRRGSELRTLRPAAIRR